MLSVLLNILSVIGIILLILLGIILFILLTVLFVPITYRITGVATLEKREVIVRGNWLFGLVRFRLKYLDQLQWSLKVLWIDLKNLKNKKAKTDAPTQHVETPAQSKEDDVQAEDSSTQDSANSVQDSTNGSQIPETAIPHKQSLKDKLTTFINKLKNLYETIQYYLEVLRHQDTKDLFFHGMGVFGKILRSIRPRKLKVKGIIGFESPDVTGKVYGYICMLYPFYGNNVSITPDFENKILEGDLYCRGHVFMSAILWNAFKILLNRKLYKVIHKFKNGGNSKNGR